MDGIIILLFEDEALIQLATQEALESGGYQVLCASDGEAAQALIDQHIENTACIVTDVQLGAGPSGWQLARHAREKRPNTPVVYATSGTPDEWAAEGVPESLLVRKPYAAAQIVTAVSTLLVEGNSKLPG